MEKPAAVQTEPVRLAAFGFRSLPPQAGSAGSDKFAEELLVRLAQAGFDITAYTRIYRKSGRPAGSYRGVKIVGLRTVRAKGFDTLWHSFKATLHIILRNTGSVVHVHNGGNSVWALWLRLSGKRVIVTQDGVDWNRDKWPWYGRLFLRMSTFVTARAPSGVVFDNVFAKEEFEKRFGRRYHFIPYGSESAAVDESRSDVLRRFGLKPKDYILFVGRFIPDKGLLYLIRAFERVKTAKRLVLVGGSPNPSAYETRIRSTQDDRVVFPGYVYGGDAVVLMKNAYLYVQPSDVEGLSPAILSVMGLGTPLLCSDIKENVYVVGDTALMFRKGDTSDLAERLEFALSHEQVLRDNGARGQRRALDLFSWEAVTRQYAELFRAAD